MQNVTPNLTRFLGDESASRGTRSAFLAMVKPSNLRNRGDFPLVRRLDRARVGTVHVARQVGSRPIVVLEIRAKNPPEVRLYDGPQVFAMTQDVP